MDLELDYPDDDLDAMLDDELEVRKELEREKEMKENIPSSPSASLGGVKHFEGNVGIGTPAQGGNKRLRSAGDEDDINWNSIEDEMELIKNSERSPGSKRLKTLDGEAKVLSDISNTSSGTAPSSNTISAPKVRTIFKRPPFGDFQSVTCEDGNKFYLKMTEDDGDKVSVEDNDQRIGFTKAGLCGDSYYQLYDQATAELNRLTTAAFARSSEPSENIFTPEDVQTELWVEKYKPKSYIDLLSDDGTNRTLLMWLKLWDKLVFNKERKVKPKKEEDPNKPKYGNQLPDVTEEFDSQGRPVQTVALLHGPPGLGKTTLAHIVAKHAGYKVVEMNASDDRSLETFSKKFESSTQMKSVVTEDKRPICLIIDEIDGSPAPTINYLVSALTGKLAEKGKKKGDKIIIRRPIICICNDLFTPALRALRKLALIVPFPPTVSSKLAQRLKEITALEKLNADLSSLLALCKKSDNDIRSCLSTLQFVKKQSNKLRQSDVATINLGAKDTHKSSLKVLDEIFDIPRGEDGGSKQKMCNVPERYKKILATVQSCGEYEKVAQGVFDNYVNMKFRDMRLENVTKSLDWFTCFDLMQQEIRHSQIYSLMAYLPFTLVLAHLMFGSTVKQRVNILSQATEVHQKVEQNKNILASLVQEMSPTARVFCTNTALVRELLPAILSVIQPNIRPVNTQLFSAREKAELENVVAVHVAYNLTYQQEKDPETGQYVYRMDPDVENIVCYPGTKRLINLTYGIKQMIAHEVEIVKMRQEGSSGERSKTPTEELMETDVDRTPRGSKKTTNHLAKLTAKPVEFKTRAPTDFFGRALKVNPKKEENKNNVIKSDIWFKFKEGYSNAVRRNLKVKEFM